MNRREFLKLAAAFSILRWLPKLTVGTSTRLANGSVWLFDSFGISSVAVSERITRYEVEKNETQIQ